MTHLKLTHPTRDTLTFRTGQQDEYGRQAVANTTAELGTDRPTLVHTETREGERTIRGSVTGLRRKRNSGASDAVQALANYADELEKHVDEYQGNPIAGQYTLEDTELSYSKNAVLEGIEWSLTPGRVFELGYEATVLLGRPTFELRDTVAKDPSVDTTQTPMLIVDGNDLPGMRDYQMSKSVGIEMNPVFDRDNAENNDALFEEGTTRTITFEGVHTGTLSSRQTADANLDALVATKTPVSLETKFPGYNLDVTVMNYQSTLEQQRGGNSHRYRIEMIEGKRA